MVIKMKQNLNYDNYNVISQESVYEETEKRSKFITYSLKVQNIDEIEEKLYNIKKKHWDAKHHVYAYVLSSGNNNLNNLTCDLEKFSDDGEPTGTGGAPIMEIIKSNNIKNILIIVVRYFGGILLGTGNLRRMYSSGAKNIILKSGIKKLNLCNLISVTCDYKNYKIISNTISNFNTKIINTNFENNININFYVLYNQTENIMNQINNILKNNINTKIISSNYQDV